MRCVNMKWICWVLWKIQSRHDAVHRRTRWNQYYPLQLRWAGGNKTVLVSTLEYLKVPGQDAFTKPACINTMIYRICYQIFVTYVISNTVWNKVRYPFWPVRSVAKDQIMNASYTRWMCLRRRLMPLAHRKLQLDWTPLDYPVYITCVVPVNLAPYNTRKQAWRRGNLGQVTELRLSCYLVLLSIDSKTR